METVDMKNIFKDLQVDASQQTCFEVFTNKIDLWWPKTHHVGKFPMIETVLEAKPGGRWYSRHEDGSEVNVGFVSAYDPFDKLILIWQVNGNFISDPNLSTEVEINFIKVGPASTRVTLEHRDLDKLTGGTKVIGSMDEGWGMILNLFKKVADEA